jgi:Putative adhesin
MKATTLFLAALALSTGVVAHAAEEGSFDKSLSISGPVDLDVKTESGGITISQGSSGSLRIHAILKAEHGWFGSDNVEERMRELERNPPVEQNGNKVRVGYVQGRDLLKGISMRLEIETPRDTQLRARAESGGIHVQGVRGPVDVKTESGGIEIHDIEADVHAAAESGGLHIRNIKGPVFARAESGGIEALEVAGALDVETQSGSVRLSQTVAAAIHAKAESGGVTVKLAPGAGYDVSAGTESGRITIPEMTVSSAFSKHHVEGKVRGGGPMVKIHAESGSVGIE